MSNTVEVRLSDVKKDIAAMADRLSPHHSMLMLRNAYRAEARRMRNAALRALQAERATTTGQGKLGNLKPALLKTIKSGSLRDGSGIYVTVFNRQYTNARGKEKPVMQFFTASKEATRYTRVSARNRGSLRRMNFLSVAREAIRPVFEKDMGELIEKQVNRITAKYGY